jgi:glycosyltransferase involved in cell wall biosynthesis
MRILVATTHRTVVGGVETYLRVLLPQLRERGHEVALLHEAEAAPGQPTVDGKCPGLRRWRVGEDGVRAALAAAPDVCFLQGLESPAVERELLDRVPVVLFAHNYHGTCISGTKEHSRPCPRPCDRTLGPGCLAAYFPHRCGGLNPLTAWRLYRLQQRRRRLLPRYAAVAVASRHMHREYSRHGVRDDRLQVLPLFPPGVAPSPEPPRLRPLSGRVLMVGRLTAVKGCRQLVEAAALARPRLGRGLTLVVAGDGPERGAMEESARRAGLPAEFTGWVDARTRGALMAGADVLAVPSVWPEPFGLVGLEAGCLGVPAVAYAVGGVPDWLRPGESGELAPADPPTAAGLADALLRALGHPDRLGRLGQGAWRVAGEFTAERHLSRLEGILAAAAGGVRPARVPLPTLGG